VKLALEFNYQASEQFSLQLDSHLPLKGITAIFGPSGCGKTTLLRLISGLDTPHQGRISVNGTEWFNSESGVNVDPRLRRIGYVFQDGRLFPHMTAEENLHFAASLAHREPAISFNSLIAALDIQPLLSLKPSQLSGGQSQRVSLARTLLSAPELILLDEPLSALDRPSRELILDFIGALQHSHEIPMLYVSHELDELLRLTDFALVLDKGRQIAFGDTIETFSQLHTQPYIKEPASLLETTVRKHDHRYGLTQAQCKGGQRIWFPALGHNIGDRIRLRVAARDVSLATIDHDDSSHQNRLRVTVDEMVSLNGHSCLIRLRLEQGFLLSQISRRAADQMDLHPGKAVIALIKSTSVSC